MMKLCVVILLVLSSFTFAKPCHYILTGGPGAGKTSILLKLERLGHGIVREAATDISILHLAQGEAHPWTRAGYDDEVLNLQKERQATALFYPHERVFFDRSPLDVLAYATRGGKHDEVLEKKVSVLLQEGSYAPIVFLVENMGSCQQSLVRAESNVEALELQHAQEANYRKQGFRIVRVPPGSVDSRVQVILNAISEHENKITTCCVQD